MNMIKSIIDFNEKKGFICDMDGVIYHGNQILPGVPEFIQWLHDEKKEYLFLTNNSGYTPRELNQKLARMGLDVPEEHFYTSALATAAFLKEQAAGCSAFVIGEAGLLNALYDVGITMNDVNPDYVVVGEGRSYSLDTLTKATNLVLKGAKLIGANSDVSGPIENGIAPACRALVAPIEMATGTQAYFCGKPNPLMMRTGLNMLGCHSAEAVMVGDRMDTDVISGMESGMSTVLVLSGCSTKDTLKTYAYLPTMVLNGVGDIASMAKAKEEEKAFCQEQNDLATQAVLEAIHIVKTNGILENKTLKFFRDRYNSKSFSVVNYLMRKYEVNVPLRTQGWINDKLVSVTIENGRCEHLKYMKAKGGQCSQRFFDCMNELIQKVTTEAVPELEVG